MPNIEPDTIVLSKNILVPCFKCNEGLRVAEDLKARDIGECSLCNAEIEILDYTIQPLRKIDPTEVKGYAVLRKHVDVEASEEDEPILFADIANKLRDNVRSSVDLINQLYQELQNFSDEVIDNFASENQYLATWDKYIDREKALAFSGAPFSSLNLASSDKGMDGLCKLVFLPKFFDPPIGLKFKSMGGMNAYIVTPYSRVRSEMHDVFAKYIGLPESLKLKVVGNKIIGPSLNYCIKDIPGIYKDIDDSESHRSVFIQNSLSARQWLARNGVSPWSPNEMNCSILEHETAIRERMKESAFTQYLWKEFTSIGRISIWTDSLKEARAFAMMAVSSIPGVQVLFGGTRDSVMQWPAHNPHGEKTFSYSNKFVKFINGEGVVWDSVLRSKVILLDLTEHIDPVTLEYLYRYPGKIIGVGADPLFDATEDNYYANLVHGLFSKPIHLYREGISFNQKMLMTLEP